jgi:hypothetical protein
MAIVRIKMGAVLVGWITCLFVLFAVIAVAAGAIFASGFDLTSIPYNLSKLGKEIPLPVSVSLAIPAVMFLAFFIGGYVAGRMAALSGIINGAMTVATSALFLSLAVVFLKIVGRKLGIDLIGIANKTLAPFTVNLIEATVFAVAGSMLGGKLGEGYIKRLDSKLNNLQENEDKTY